jgi:hypothetical protein
MAQTISELEKERAKLLEAIEAQANQLSMQRGQTTNEARPHTLNDWLNAAEQVVPAKKEPKLSYDEDYSALTKPRNAPQSSRPSFNPQDFAEPEVSLSQEGRLSAQDPNKKKNAHNPQQAKHAQKASFFGVVIMLSLLLTMLGVLYVAYNAIQTDIKKIMAVHTETLDGMTELQLEVLALKEQLEKGGDSLVFDQLIDRIDQQQLQLTDLNQALAQATQTLPTNAIRELQQNLERQMETRLQGMLTQLALSTSEQQRVEPAAIAEPEPIVPRIEQKVVRLVEAKAPVDPDVNWLKQQPADHFVLQLASMPERSGIEQVIADKRIQNGRIIPQIRDGRQSFLLVVGSHAQRAQANQMAIDIKDNAGISPWIRRVRDLSNRVD